MTWFADLTGFEEVSPEQVRENLRVDGVMLSSLVNGESWCCGSLETPTLGDLRRQVAACPIASRPTSVREVLSDVQALHRDPANSDALFQVASQFNLLEMAHPSVSPEEGVGIYERDRTQGPACAIAAGAGTIYRNYFAPVDAGVGQTSDHQIDCLADVGAAIGNHDQCLWQMQNGYALPTPEGLTRVDERLSVMGDAELDLLRQRLRIGIQWRTAVTLPGCTHQVTQAYCSALPVAYSSLPSARWERFARLILEAAYEATLCAGILNQHKNGSAKIHLTLLGGGVFGNDPGWIIESMHRALDRYRGEEKGSGVKSTIRNPTLFLGRYFRAIPRPSRRCKSRWSISKSGDNFGAIKTASSSSRMSMFWMVTENRLLSRSTAGQQEERTA